MDQHVQELATLYPAPRHITVAGRTIEIKPCGISQAGRIIDAGLPLYQRTLDGVEFPDLFDQFPDETCALLVAATGAPADWIAGLDPVEKFELAAAWMEANAAFFVRRLVPAIARFNRALTSINGDGPTSSSTSSGTATSTPASTPQQQPAPSSQPSIAPTGATAASA